jgi:hypothetical protein
MERQLVASALAVSTNSAQFALTTPPTPKAKSFVGTGPRFMAALAQPMQAKSLGMKSRPTLARADPAQAAPSTVKLGRKHSMALSKDDLRKQAETSSVNTDLKAKDDDNDQQRLERRRQTRWQMGAFP